MAYILEAPWSFLSRMTYSKTVEGCGGVIINFIGDAVLASFDLPRAIANAADATVRCYREFRVKLAAEAEERKRVRSC
jgi:class 3 adenylate cyclase